MAIRNYTKIDDTIVVDGANKRVFLPSNSIKVFPCSRRGQDANNVAPFDPEARLNTEYTNRIHTAANGFKDSFIISYEDSLLKFALAGYYFEVKDFNPDNISQVLSGANAIYAHLSLYTGIPLSTTALSTTSYTTEILHCQLPTDVIDSNFLDVPYEDNDYFFFGVSFTANSSKNDTALKDTITISGTSTALPASDLRLFNKTGSGTWQLEQTSLLPSIDHDTAENSVVLGELHVEQNLQVDADVNFGTTVTNADGDTVATGGNLTANSVSVPYTGSINLADDTTGDKVTDTKISTKGVITPYVRAGSIKSDGVAVGEAITIVDDEDNTLTTVAGEYISTVGYGKFDKYLNVGAPTNPTTTNGDIVAKHDIVAENNIKVLQNAEVQGGLTVKAGTTKTIVAISDEGVTLDSDAKLVVKKLDSTDTTNKEIEIPNGTALKVNNINSGEGAGLTIQQDTGISKTLTIAGNGANANKDALKVTSGNTSLQGLSAGATTASSLTVSGNTTVNGTTTLQGLTATGITATGITVDSGTVSASTFTQNSKPVPSIDVVEQAGGTWQLQISRVTTTDLPVTDDEN